jgi:hypothetical protein
VVLILVALCLVGAAGAMVARRGITNAPASVPSAAGVANAPASVPSAGAGLANAPAPVPGAGGLANAPAPTPTAAGLANGSGNPGPREAAPLDDVRAYLDALSKIEAARQQANSELEQDFSGAAHQAAGGSTVSDPQAAMARILASEIASIGSDSNGPDPLTSYLQKLTPAVSQIVDVHVQLLEELDGLAQTPGVPPSCTDLQGYYRAAITPFVSLANAERKNPVQFLQQAMQAQQEESTRLVEANQELNKIFRTHQLQPFFQIQDTEDTGQGGNIMSAPYVPGH